MRFRMMILRRPTGNRGRVEHDDARDQTLCKLRE